MADTGISPTSGIRDASLFRKETNGLSDRANERPSAGAKVTGASNAAAVYVAEGNHTDRAGSLQKFKDAMSEGVRTIEAASEGIESIAYLVKQAKAIVNSARTAEAADLAGLQAKLDELLSRIDDTVAGAGYNGANLLDGAVLKVMFKGAPSLEASGFDGSSAGLGLTGAADLSDAAELDRHAAEIDTALSTLKIRSQALASNLAVFNTTKSFASNMLNALLNGAGDLSVADMSEEGANLLALETRRSLSGESSGMASDATATALRLFP